MLKATLIPTDPSNYYNFSSSLQFPKLDLDKFYETDLSS